MSTAVAHADDRAKHCTAPEYHQLDFWIGDWNAFDLASGSQDAHVRVDSILDGCVLHERYDGADGHRGESFSVYDVSRNVWHQTWVTNRGELLTIEGNMQDGAMALAGADLNAAGQDRRVRGDWKPADGGVRETAVTSTDGGKTWSPWFDLMFRPAQSNRFQDDEKTIIELDNHYQAAVKHNDATTMDRLLADDFLLVTGLGKRYSKADLLEEARGCRVTYEHQEDTEQGVRVWGDTAVLTAKLWEKGTNNGQAFDKTLWFSDTYVRMPGGWKYVFGQSSIPVPVADPHP
jgi:ketosteroid isomerase-like protein